MLAATLACLLSWRGDAIDLDSHAGLTEFAEFVRDVERNEGGVVCGYQDAYMICHGGLQLMDFAGKHPVDRGPVGSLTQIEAPTPFLLVTTGVERLSGSVHGPVIDRWLRGEKDVVAAMEFLPSLAEAGAAALIRRDYAEVGRMMDENHRITASLGGSGEAIDALIARCKAHGATGAKLAGAGMGGTVIALAEDLDELETRLRADGFTKFLRPAAGPGVRFES